MENRRVPKSRLMGDREDSATGEVRTAQARGALPIFPMLRAWGMPLLFGQVRPGEWP